MTDALVRDADAADAPEPSRRTGSATRRPTLPLAGGWVSQALVLVMLLAAGMAIHDLRPAGLPAGAGATSWLPLLMVAAGLMGGVLAATRLRAGWVDLIAALVGTLVGLVVVAGVISDAPSLTDRLHALEASVVGAVRDLLVERGPSAEVSPVLLTLSALAWTTGAYAAISVGRYARASGAIVPVGLMLLVPVILAEIQGQDGGQLLWLTIGVTAALLLVLRLNLERQRVRWLRRHVTGGRSVGRAFLGGGAVLVSAVTVGAVGLTAVVGSAPLQAGWERLGGVLTDLGVDVGQLRQPPVSTRGEFPDSMRLDDHWEPRDVTYFTVSTTDEGVYWRGKTYDRFDGKGWHRGEGVGVDVGANEDLLGVTADDASVDGEGFREVDAVITFQDIGGGELVAPQNPLEAELDTRVLTLGAAGGPFQVLEPRELMGRGDAYAVRAEEPDLDPGSLTGLTASRLRAVADAPQPDWTKSYLQRPEGGVGKLTKDTAARIAGDLPRRDRSDRYQVALAVQRYLTSAPFTYDTDLRGLCRPGQTKTDCLLESSRGFCEQYATTMVMLLRELEVPARYVVGFLPGVELREGEYEVGGGASHAWVEVWFDGYGWLRFDPTPGAATQGNALDVNGQVQTELPAGDETPSTDPGPDGSLGPDESLDPDETIAPDESDAPTPEPSIAPGTVSSPGSGSAGSSVALLAAGLVAGLLVLAALMLLWFRRLPSGGPERAWAGITGIATRFGRGPTVTQTPYEYSVKLSRVVPRVAEDIRTVADAKVAATYGPDHAGPSSVATLRAAYARARTGLLALLFRRR